MRAASAVAELVIRVSVLSTNRRKTCRSTMASMWTDVSGCIGHLRGLLDQPLERLLAEIISRRLLGVRIGNRRLYQVEQRGGPGMVLFEPRKPMKRRAGNHIAAGELVGIKDTWPHDGLSAARLGKPARAAGKRNGAAMLLSDGSIAT